MSAEQRQAAGTRCPWARARAPGCALPAGAQAATCHSRGGRRARGAWRQRSSRLLPPPGRRRRPPIGRPLLPDPSPSGRLRGRRFLLARAPPPPRSGPGRIWAPGARRPRGSARQGAEPRCARPFLPPPAPATPPAASRPPARPPAQAAQANAAPRPAAERRGCGGARGCCCASRCCGCWASPTTCTPGAAPRWPRARAAPAGR